MRSSTVSGSELRLQLQQQRDAGGPPCAPPHTCAQEGWRDAAQRISLCLQIGPNMEMKPKLDYLWQNIMCVWARTAESARVLSWPWAPGKKDEINQRPFIKAFSVWVPLPSLFITPYDLLGLRATDSIYANSDYLKIWSVSCDPTHPRLQVSLEQSYIICSRIFHTNSSKLWWSY